MTITKRINEFVAWVRSELNVHRNKPAAQVAQLLCDGLLKVDERLGVEVAEESGLKRNVIITSFSDSRLFPIVQRIVARLKDLEDWNFIALKPPRGFAFYVAIGTHRIQANDIAFSIRTDDSHGIYLYVPRHVFADLPRGTVAEELAWLVIESGIGEELSAKLHSIEFRCDDEFEDRQPISDLASLLASTTP